MSGTSWNVSAALVASTPENGFVYQLLLATVTDVNGAPVTGLSGLNFVGFRYTTPQLDHESYGVVTYPGYPDSKSPLEINFLPGIYTMTLKTIVKDTYYGPLSLNVQTVTPVAPRKFDITLVASTVVQEGDID